MSRRFYQHANPARPLHGKQAIAESVRPREPPTAAVIGGRLITEQACCLAGQLPIAAHSYSSKEIGRYNSEERLTVDVNARKLSCS